MLRRIGMGCFDGASLLRCRHSNWLSLRSVHLVPICGHRRKLSDSPVAPATTKDLRWSLLNLYGCCTNDTLLADAKTVADSFTSMGRHLRVSLAHATPPASSFLYYGWPGGVPDGGADDHERLEVVAAHDGSVLFEMKNSILSDYFVYSHGSAAAGPSLSLVPYPYEGFRLNGYTGLLRQSEESDELREIQLRLLYPGEDTFGDGQLMEGWEIYRTIPVGNRFLCWVEDSGFFLCDMLDEGNPKVRGACLPHELLSRYDDDADDNDMPPLKHSKNMGAAGASALRFVSIDSRCCCSGTSRSTCAGSRFAFTVTIWTMELGTDEPLTWVKDGVLDCVELWAQPGYEGLPRTHLKCPVVSLDNPDVVCFTVSNYYFVSYQEYKVWMIQVNMRSKTMLSVVQFPKDDNDRWKAYHHLPADLQS
ncbi:unnamed protein product [Urochloa decumbens]|uniref:DUF1618 domain-containing protein n=1 Tax=Urochloa decumbens TaxID=240449 RepID=A0ABC9B7K4_9POAL